jgi:hypothetical protein
LKIKILHSVFHVPKQTQEELILYYFLALLGFMSILSAPCDDDDDDSYSAVAILRLDLGFAAHGQICTA